ncbi:MAG TPA: TIGR02186 family protein, partial [Hyphomicrobiaceae bacterium]|nr:TIGR02186 family protein [Hyphomicrobiaceae bacterium]
YAVKEHDTTFSGRSLFRTSIDLPANVSVGSFETRVFLFREGKLLSQYLARLNLEREGLERLIHGFAFQYPWFYGITTVLIALASGILASAVFSKARH